MLFWVHKQVDILIYTMSVPISPVKSRTFYPTVRHMWWFVLLVRFYFTYNASICKFLWGDSFSWWIIWRLCLWFSFQILAIIVSFHWKDIPPKYKCLYLLSSGSTLDIFQLWGQWQSLYFQQDVLNDVSIISCIVCDLWK